MGTSPTVSRLDRQSFRGPSAPIKPEGMAAREHSTVVLSVRLLVPGNLCVSVATGSRRSNEPAGGASPAKRGGLTCMSSLREG